MINQIEDAIVGRIKAKLDATAGKVAVQKGVEGIPQPAVYVSTEAGRFEKITQETFKQHLSLFVDIVFSYRGADERERRKGIYLILEGILQALLLQDLGLTIKPLVPQSLRNTTVEEFRAQGLLTFALELTTSYTISKLDAEAVTELLTIGLAYYLKAGGEIPTASDVITLEEPL